MNRGIHGGIVVDVEEFKKTYIREICRFNKLDVLDNEKKKRIFDDVKNNIHEEQVWALFATKNTDDEWICLQVGSSANIKREIIADIKCMIPLAESDNRLWNSEFHKEIFEVKYARDVRCQKYRHMRENFEKFRVVVLSVDEYIKEDNICGFDKIKYSEVKFAYKTQALYWKAFGYEYKILAHLKEKSEV